MNEYQYQEIVAMLAVLYKKMDAIECKLKGSYKSASMQSYLRDLRKEADKLKD